MHPSQQQLRQKKGNGVNAVHVRTTTTSGRRISSRRQCCVADVVVQQMSLCGRCLSVADVVVWQMCCVADVVVRQLISHVKTFF